MPGKEQSWLAGRIKLMLDVGAIDGTTADTVRTTSGGGVRGLRSQVSAANNPNNGIVVTSKT